MDEMDYKNYSNISEIKDVWESIFQDNAYLSGFQKYAWMELVEKRFCGRRPFKYIGWDLSYIVVEDNFIAPMLINKKQKKIQMIGVDSSSDYLSFIYRSSIISNLDEYCVTLFDILKGYSIQLQRINQSNPLSQILINLATKYNAKVESHVCVKIDTQNGVGTFLENSTKNARHSYNQSINRLNRDGHKISVLFNYDVVDDSTAQLLHEMYLKHRENCNENAGLDQNKLLNFANKTRATLLPSTNIDVLSEYSRIHPVWLARIYIDDELAGFWEGDVNNCGDTVSMYRTAMNEKYYWYKPGTILMVDFIEHIRGQYQYFDLTRGDEEYKFRFGGKEHYNYLFIFEL